jgi:hypothetical protein
MKLKYDIENMTLGKCFYLQRILNIFEKSIINNTDFKDRECCIFGNKLAPNCDLEETSSDRRYYI